MCQLCLWLRPSLLSGHHRQLLSSRVLLWSTYVAHARTTLQGLEGYDKYFAMARGVEDVGALDMSKYFDTNYHYLMPELNSSSSPNANFGPFLDKVTACS